MARCFLGPRWNPKNPTPSSDRAPGSPARGSSPAPPILTSDRAPWGAFQLRQVQEGALTLDVKLVGPEAPGAQKQALEDGAGAT